MQSSIHDAMAETSNSDSLSSLDQKHSHRLEFKEPMTHHPATKKTNTKIEQKSKSSGMFKVGSPGNLSPVIQRTSTASS